MPFRDIAAVTGSTRCGTSMVMRMLHRGGIPAYADNLRSCESSRVLGLPSDTAWLPECRGHALKLLEPLYRLPLPSASWRFILMKRDAREQARSQLKLVELLDLGAPPPLAVAEAALRADLPRMRQVLLRRGPVLELRFEQVLADPLQAASRLERFLGVPLDKGAMVAEVVPRSPACYPGLLEVGLAELAR
jgi:hypothetical protein